MTPKDFCCWLQGALSMATAEDGTVTFTKLQAETLKGHLVESLTPANLASQPLNRPPGARC